MKIFFRLFLLLSACAIWYITLPTSYLITILSIACTIPLYIAAFYIQVAAVRTARKRYKWARKVFINPTY